MHVPISDQEGDLLWFAWGLVGGPPPLHNAGFAVLGPVARGQSKKGVPSAVGFPHCAGSGEGLSLSPKPYPHKCVEAGARTRDLPVTDGRLYRCTRPAAPLCEGAISYWKKKSNPHIQPVRDLRSASFLVAALPARRFRRPKQRPRGRVPSWNSWPAVRRIPLHSWRRRARGRTPGG